MQNWHLFTFPPRVAWNLAKLLNFCQILVLILKQILNFAPKAGSILKELQLYFVVFLAPDLKSDLARVWGLSRATRSTQGLDNSSSHPTVFPSPLQQLCAPAAANDLVSPLSMCSSTTVSWISKNDIHKIAQKVLELLSFENCQLWELPCFQIRTFGSLGGGKGQHWFFLEGQRTLKTTYISW